MKKKLLNSRHKPLSRDDLRFKIFLGSVALHSALGTCDRLRTACGIINNKRLRGFGYNGSVSGLEHCDEVGHLLDNNHCIRTRHGEVNAITNTDRKDIQGGQAIVIATPCLDCAKDLAQEGIRRIDYVGKYDNSLGKDHLSMLAKQKNIELHSHDIDWADFFQELFDLLTRKGGILANAGYRLNVKKEPLKKEVL
ncbi:MAG: competence protein ComEB [Parcubacteria group bacterium Gr01-1014_29]|nr:MAG: competence protein ComEB [Parcubacteria group bacterium Gr01-1014_29]